MTRKHPTRQAHKELMMPSGHSPKVSRAGKIMAHCAICRGVGKADGKGTPITVVHAKNCPERVR